MSGFIGHANQLRFVTSTLKKGIRSFALLEIAKSLQYPDLHFKKMSTLIIDPHGFIEP
jgi:hypothetical protein